MPDNDALVVLHAECPSKGCRWYGSDVYTPGDEADLERAKGRLRAKHQKECKRCRRKKRLDFSE